MSPAPTIEELRRQIAALKAKRRELEAAPASLDECSAIAKATVRNLAQSCPPVRGDNIAIILHERAPALLARLCGDALEALLIEAMGADSKGLRHAERAASLEALDAEIFTLEATEEHQIRRLEKAGDIIDRRPDASPAAVLQES